MLEPPTTLLALHGFRAYHDWALKTGNAKVSQEIWIRAKKIFLRFLEPFPDAVRMTLLRFIPF